MDGKPKKLDVYPQQNIKWMVCAGLGKEKNDHEELALVPKYKFCQHINFLF